LVFYFEKFFMRISKWQLESILEKSRWKDTSSDPENWCQEIPDWFQCLSTSLAIEELLGGKIIGQEILFIDPDVRVRKRLEDNSLWWEKRAYHFFNIINWIRLDLTESQLLEWGKTVYKKQKVMHSTGSEIINILCPNISDKKNLLLNRIKKNLCEVLSINLEWLNNYLMVNKLQLID